MSGEHGGVLWQEYALDDRGNSLCFSTVKEAVNYLADRNWKIEDLREVDFNFEE
jgi:hypothetical protein